MIRDASMKRGLTQSPDGTPRRDSRPATETAAMDLAMPGTVFRGRINNKTFVPSLLSLVISLALFIPLLIAAIPGIPRFAYVIFALWSCASLAGTIAALVNPPGRSVRIDDRGIEYRNRLRRVKAAWSDITSITARTEDLSGAARFSGIPVPSKLARYPMIIVTFVEEGRVRSFTIHEGNFEDYPGLLMAIQKRMPIRQEGGVKGG